MAYADILNMTAREISRKVDAQNLVVLYSERETIISYIDSEKELDGVREMNDTTLGDALRTIGNPQTYAIIDRKRAKSGKISWNAKIHIGFAEESVIPKGDSETLRKCFTGKTTYANMDTAIKEYSPSNLPPDIKEILGISN